MPAAVHNITVEQGATFVVEFVVLDENDDPVDLTPYSARMQIRPEVSSGTVLANLTSPGDIQLGGTAGTVIVTISAATTAGFTKEGHYDLELVVGSVVERLVKGKMRLDREVTR